MLWDNQISDLNTQLNNTELTDEEVAGIQEQIDSLNTNATELNAQIATTETQLNTVQGETTTLETEIANSTNEIANLETDIVNATNNITTTEAELTSTIENVKPGVGVDSGWETVNLDTNNDGVVDEADIDA